MILRKEEVEQYEELIGECFSEDEELIEEWHVAAGEGLDACVEDTIETLRTQAHSSFRFFEVLEEDKRIGFFGTEHLHALGFLTTFFIRPKYRKKKYILAYWDLISRYFDCKEFTTAIWAQNARAYDHLLRLGGELEKRYIHSEKQKIVYIIKINTLCQQEVL